MFRGQYEHTLDSKGRVSLPSRFREALEQLDLTGDSVERLILTRTFHPCLVAYPLETWLAFEEKLRRLPQLDPNVQLIKRVFIAGAIECTLDRQGRLLVPPAMRSALELDREVTWVGQIDTMELWDRQSWQQAQAQALADPKALAAALASLGL